MVALTASLGVVRSRPNGLSLSVPRATGGGGGVRGEVRGWSRKAAARHVRWLQQVDPSGLDGLYGYAITLTIRDIPSPEEWQQMRSGWLRKVKKLGALLGHWVVELQRRGAPHIHAALYFDRSLTCVEEWQIIQAWLKYSASFRSNSSSQDIREIEGDGTGWAKYQAKHSARSVYHYQRSEIPPNWEKTGRLWGHFGDWPLREVEYIVTSKALYELRRLIKRYAISDARKEPDPIRRKKRLRACKKLLRGEHCGLSGMREWVPESVQYKMLEWITSQDRGMVWTREEFDAMFNKENQEEMTHV